MPELPEVETIVQSLAPRLLGRRVTSAKLLWPKTLATPQSGSIGQQLVGRKFESVSRIGKFLVFRLGAGQKSGRGAQKFMLVHLRMSGSLAVVKAQSKLQVHDRAVIGLDNRKELRFNDIRKFGRMYLLDDYAEITKRLGPDAILQTPSEQEFFLALRARKARLKSLLLNQTFLAGLGNIYVDESLWLARLHPLTRSDRLSRQEASLLRRSILKVLRHAIRHSGTDAGDGVVDFGRNKPKIYGRAGLPCKRCGKPAVRIVVGQRGTHLCPQCQKAK